MLDGSGVSGFKSKDILPILTSCEYQGSNDKVIVEGNSDVSCWISKVASTRVRLFTGGVTLVFLSKEQGSQRTCRCANILDHMDSFAPSKRQGTRERRLQ